jgi:antitoxin HicB
MSKHTYAIVLEPQPGGGYVVSVPALPEIVTEGDNKAEAISMAREAIQLAIEHRQSKGIDIPPGPGPEVLEVTVESAE